MPWATQCAVPFLGRTVASPTSARCRYLRKHPECEIYNNQDEKNPRREAEMNPMQPLDAVEMVLSEEGEAVRLLPPSQCRPVPAARLLGLLETSALGDSTLREMRDARE